MLSLEDTGTPVVTDPERAIPAFGVALRGRRSEVPGRAGDTAARSMRGRIPLVVRSSSCVTHPAAMVKPQPEAPVGGSAIEAAHLELWSAAAEGQI